MMRPIRRTSLAAALLSLSVAGCTTSDPAAVAPPEIRHTDTFEPSGPTPRGPGVLRPGLDDRGREARRMTVAQLRASIPALFDGVVWEGQVGNLRAPMFDLLSRTLGEADYLQITQENTDPSPLFAKFMDDMAGMVCSTSVTNDRAKPAADRVVMPYDTDVAANIRWLRLKLHGIYVPEGETDGIEDLVQLHTDITNDTGDADQGWTGVCVAMLTAPEFLAY